jgi:Secretion system C-terminal sorting domain/Dockerin type I domain
LNGTVMGAFTTRADGAFTIGGLTMGQNYAVRGERTDNPLNGVTTYDIALVSRHILGSETLNTPYKIIAADVNGDRDINTADMISLRRLILHISTTLPNNIPSWRFVNGDYTFRNRENPLGEDFPEVVNATNATRTNAASFVGIKVGDLNSSATANGLEGLGIRGAAGTLTLKTDDLNLVAGKTYTVKLSATEFNVIGMQGTFNFAKGYVDQISVTGQLPNMGEGNFGLFDNAVTTSWNGKAIAETDVLTLTFRAKQNGKLSEVLTVGSNLTYAEGYNATGESFSVNLQFNNGKVTGNEFTLYQNEPNPFDGTTKIGFSLPEAANATLTVYDATGKILSVKEGNYTSGYNAINISKTDVNANGVLFYRLDSGNNTATKKMIIIE